MAGDLDVSRESLRRRALIVEAQRIERAAWVWSVLYRLECRWWRRLNTLLLALATVLAAVSGGAGFSQLVDRRIAAAFALGAAAVAGVSTALGTATRASSAEAAASADLVVSDTARAFHLTVAPYVSLDQAVADFEKLCKQRDQVVAAMPTIHYSTSHRGRFKRLWADVKADQAAQLSAVHNTTDENDRSPGV